MILRRALLIIFLLSIQPSQAAKITYFTMNVHCALGDWQGRLNQILDKIVELDPDIIGLQEVCYSNSLDMADYILNNLKTAGYEVSFFKTLDTHRSFFKYREQLLIVSKLPVRGFVSGILPSAPTLQNGYIGIDLDSHWAIVTHLHFALPAIRRKQYQLIHSKFGSKPSILFGDLNSNPQNGETRVLADQVWTPIFNGATYPATNPNKTFDGFWLSQSFGQKVERSSIETLFLDATPAPSDHLGLFLRLDLK